MRRFFPPAAPTRVRIGVVVLLGVSVVIAVYFLVRPHPPAPPDEVSGIEQLEDYLNELTVAGPDAPTAVTLVVVDSQGVRYAEAFGMADPLLGREATVDSVYNYWSMTKPFTAVAVMQLAERGLVDLEKPVREYLDFFDVALGEETTPVTVVQLLNHSSGLPNNVPEVVGWVHTEGEPEWNQTELIRQHLPEYRELKFQPGSRGEYTNVGYMVLAALIESVAGVSYEQYVRANILAPLGMERTDFTVTEAMGSDEAVGTHPRLDVMAALLPFLIEDHRLLFRDRSDGRIWFNRVYSDQNGPTGLIGPAGEAGSLPVALLNDGALPDGSGTLLRPESVHAMTREYRVVPGKTPESQRYEDVLHGPGWFVVTSPDLYLEHSGGGPGFRTGMRIYPDRDLGIVLMSNGTYTDEIGIIDLAASLEWS